MAKSFHENDLLELVEGTLESGRANAMRAKLASEPSLMHLVEGMTADREALRSVAEPPLPMDFVSELGPRLARPMLMEPVHVMKPGEFRRQQRRAARAQMWKRMAIAAGIMVMTGVSGVVLVRTVMVKDGGGMQAGNGGPAIGAGRPAEGAQGMASIEGAEGTMMMVEHSLPKAGLGRAESGQDGTPSTQVVKQPDLNAQQRLERARFAVVMHGVGEPAVKERLRELVLRDSRGMALASNFSYQEAKVIEERLARGGKRASGSDEQAANAHEGSRGERTAGRSAGRSAGTAGIGQAAKDEMRSRGEASGLVAGSAKLIPSLEQQLEFSQFGAGLTVTVDARKLVKVLEEISEQVGARVALQMMDVEGAASRPAEEIGALMRWLNDLPAIREEISRLEGLPAGTSVMVPVVVEQEVARP